MPVGLHERGVARLAVAPVAAVVAVVAVGGCSGRGSAEEGAVGDAATAFLAAVSSAPDRACDLLAPATLETLRSDGDDCASTLAEVAADGDLAATQPTVQVYGRDAMVRWGAETLFLARFDDGGWLVTAAGCQPRGEDVPFDCTVEGR